METNELEEPKNEHDLALERVKKRRDLQGHALAYVVFNAGLWIVWAVTGAGYAWPAWISGFWAVGLVMNAWDVYVRRPITEADVQQELTRLHPRV